MESNMIVVRWQEDDISTLRTSWTEDQITEFIANWGNKVRDSMIEQGWEILEASIQNYECAPPATPDYKFQVCYSARRGEVQVLDKKDELQFVLSEDDTLVDVALLSNDELLKWVLSTHYQELEAFGLV